MTGRGLLIVAAGAALVGWPGQLRAETATLVQEYVGFEVTPVSLGLAGVPAGRDGGVPFLQAGPGAAIRFGRHRWRNGYLIPFQGGIYVSSRSLSTIYLYAQIEGGIIVPGTNRRLELGLGVGRGMLAMAYRTGCDGNCYVGGKGLIFSPVARYLFLDKGSFALGANLRAVIPLDERGGGFLPLDGWGSTLIGAFEIGWGRG